MTTTTVWPRIGIAATDNTKYAVLARNATAVARARSLTAATLAARGGHLHHRPVDGA
jgi:hypothetical protein